MPNAMRKFLKKLRNYFIRPLVMGLYSSLKQDQDTWKWSEGYEDVACTLTHSSNRFRVILWDCDRSSIQIIDQDSEKYPEIKLTALENFILTDAVKSWVNQYHKHVLNTIRSIMKEWRRVV